MFIFPIFSPDIRIITSTDEVYEDFTKGMTLTCKLSHLAVVNSLTLSKADTQGSFQEIAMVTLISPDRVNVKESLGASKVTGSVSMTRSAREAHLTYIWKYPEQVVTGKYMCTAHGMDKLGHPVTDTATAEVREQEMNMDIIIKKIQTLEMAQDAYRKKIEKQERKITGLVTEIAVLQNQVVQDETKRVAQTQTIVDLESKQTGILTEFAMLVSKLNSLQGCCKGHKTHQNAIKSAMTQDSVVYKGHEYMVSTPTWMNVPVADVMCRMFGGYLAEIEDKEELKVVGDLVSRSGDHEGTGYNMVGGTDLGCQREGNWTYLYSQKPASFLEWHAGYGNRGTSRNCLYISSTSHKLWDYFCQHAQLARFVCEIPL